MRLTDPHLLGFLLLANACATGGEDSNTPVATTTHALLRVERSERVGAANETSGMAFAGVVRVPELADPEPLFKLSGKAPTLPAPGQCLATSHERDAVPGELSRAEFLDAGRVLLGATTSKTLLAPRAFPSSPTQLSGVVYTSRDRASEPLPSGAQYLLTTTGSDQLPALTLRVQAPDELRDVTVENADLDTLASLSGVADVPLSWRAGDARDLVYVEVAGSADVGTLGTCAFRDSDGRGSLPRGLFGASGVGSLTFHRLREVAAEVPALDGAEVRFDFALSAEVTFR